MSRGAAHLRDVAVRFCAVLGSICLLVPWDPQSFAHEPRDAAYVIFSHIDFTAGAPWGGRTLHTSGPLGFLRFPYFHDQTYWLLIIGNAAVAAAMALVLDEIARARVRRWIRLPVVMAGMAILASTDEAVWLFSMLAPQLLIPSVSWPRLWSTQPDAGWFSWPFLVSLAASGFAANTKGLFLLMAGVLVVQPALLELHGRRVPIVSIGLVLWIGAWPTLAGFRMEDWGPYAHHVVESVIGYAESFSQAGSPVRATILIASVGFFVMLTARLAVRCDDRFSGLVRWSALTMLVWIAAKGALVRQDWQHETRVAAALGIFFGFYVLAQRVDLRAVAGRLYLAPPVGVGVVFILSWIGALQYPLTTVQHRPTMAQQRGTLLSFLTRGSRAAERDADARRAVETIIQNPWPPTSSIAAFGSYQSLLLGHPARRITLPVVASYEIWSPWTV